MGWMWGHPSGSSLVVLWAAGEDIAGVSGTLGHSTVSTTLNIYTTARGKESAMGAVERGRSRATCPSPWCPSGAAGRGDSGNFRGQGNQQVAAKGTDMNRGSFLITASDGLIDIGNMLVFVGQACGPAITGAFGLARP